MTPEKTKRNDKMYALHKKGISYRQIGKLFGVRGPTVFEIIQRIKERKGVEK